MQDVRHQRGRDGESISVAFLQFKGAQILDRNWRPKSKLRGEIDIVAMEEECICFVEVKTRSSIEFGEPQEAVNQTKQRQLAKLGAAFLSERELTDISYRFDVVEVWLLDGQKPRINWIRDAFGTRDW